MPTAETTLLKARLALYREAQRKLGESFNAILAERAPVSVDNVDALEEALIASELAIGLDYARALHDLKPCRRREYPFVHQRGATCMSTSLANALIALGDPFLLEDPPARVHAFTDHVVAHTSDFGKPFEYRSIDDMHKYLRREEHLGRGSIVSGLAMTRRYRCELTNSLIDVIDALHLGRGQVVVQSHAHAQLVFELVVDDQEVAVRQRDPFTSYGSERSSLIDLERWRRSYLWSPLKKIPSTMGRGFELLEHHEVLEHLARYEAMDNLGIECISGIILPLG